MKTNREITEIIKKSIFAAYKDFASNQANLIGEGDYDIKIGDQRILESEKEADEQNTPQDEKKSNRIYVVVKLGNGQYNFAVSNFTCEIQVISEDGSFDIAQGLLRQFIENVNFEYVDGIIQTFLNPEIVQENADVYIGVRAILSCKGNIIVPESDPFANLITNVEFSWDSGVTWAELPFINVTFGWLTTPDPQAFPPKTLNAPINLAEGITDHGGWTSSVNKQSTTTIGFTTYLFDFNSKSVTGYDTTIKATGYKANGYEAISYQLFSVVMGNEINKQFRIRMKSSVGTGTTYFLDDYFVLTGYNTNQAWGNTAPISLTFTKAAKQ